MRGSQTPVKILILHCTQAHEEKLDDIGRLSSTDGAPANAILIIAYVQIAQIHLNDND
jgi:hypothetical protein